MCQYPRRSRSVARQNQGIKQTNRKQCVSRHWMDEEARRQHWRDRLLEWNYISFWFNTDRKRIPYRWCGNRESSGPGFRFHPKKCNNHTTDKFSCSAITLRCITTFYTSVGPVLYQPNSEQPRPVVSHLDVHRHYTDWTIISLCLSKRALLSSCGWHNRPEQLLSDTRHTQRRRRSFTDWHFAEHNVGCLTVTNGPDVVS